MEKKIFLIICCLAVFFFGSLVYADSTEDKNITLSNELKNKAYDLQIAGNLDEALSVVNQAIELNPNNVRAWGTKGSILYNSKKYDEALVAINRASQLSPDLPDILINMQKDAMQKIELTKNLSTGGADSTEEKNITSSDELNNKAFDLQNAGNFDEALSVVNQAIELNPNNSYAWATKGSVLIKLNKFDEALSALNQSLQLNPDDSTILKMQRDVMQKIESTKNLSNGGADSTEGVNIALSNELTKKAFQLQLGGNYDEALSVINQSIEQNPNNSYAWATKGSILIFQKKYDEALLALNQSLQLNPDDTTVLKMQTDVMQSVGTTN